MQTADPCPDIHSVLQHLSDRADAAGGYAQLGSFSATIYDTAWLSMVYRYDAEQPYCLFPQCFAYIVETQRPDGTWPAYGSSVDSIVNSLAALLSIATHARKNAAHTATHNLAQRIDDATRGIQSILQAWDVSTTAHVGFEVIVTSMLLQLDKLGIAFTFDAYNDLYALYQRKTRNFSPDLIYSKRQTSILHSVEALVGVIDFSKISHHCSETYGILGSPAATAAYLNNAEQWDPKAEAYLRKVLKYYGNTGQVPSAYPTCFFEISWAVSTILSSTQPQVDRQHEQTLSVIKAFLINALSSQAGVVGFAPGVLADADDTARILIALTRLGHDIDPLPMISSFETAANFKTYDFERNPSFTTNCNVLLALLESKSIDELSPQILKTLHFLLQSWDATSVSDKWNLSPAYSLMLLTEALCSLLRRYHEGHQWLLPESSKLGKIAAVLCQIAHRVLKEQLPANGSWEQTLEVTSYNALTIAMLLRLPWSESMREQLVTSLSTAQAYITSTYASAVNDRYLWVEKITFRVDSLSRMYCAAAVAAKTEVALDWTPAIQAIFSLPSSAVAQSEGLLSSMPLFKKIPLQNVELLLLQAQWYTAELHEHRHDILASDQLPVTKGKYLRFIPLIWLTCNSISPDSLSQRAIYDMAMLSLFIYQIDEFMESVAAGLGAERCQAILASLRHHCKLEDSSAYSFVTATAISASKLNPDLTAMETPDSSNGDTGSGTVDSDLARDAVAILKKFVDHVLEHAAVKGSPLAVQRLLAIDVYDFIKGHVEHNTDNAAWAQSKSTQKSFVPSDLSRGGNLYGWLHSTAAADTSCPFAFRFFSCLVRQHDEQKSSFDGARAEFYSQSVAKHLSVMCRLYNDWASADRDSAEGNLNSLDFAEFDNDAGTVSRNGISTTNIPTTTTINSNNINTNSNLLSGSNPALETNDLSNGGAVSHPAAGTSAASKKDSLMAIANFERDLMELAFARMSQAVRPAVASAIRVFVNVTDLFGQIYVHSDISSRRQQ